MRFVFFCFCFLFPVKAQAMSDNPFLSMAGKPYVEYHDDYRREMDKLSFVDSLDRALARR